MHKNYLLGILLVSSFALAQNNEALIKDLTTKMLQPVQDYSKAEGAHQDVAKLRKIAINWLDTINILRKNASFKSSAYTLCLNGLHASTEKVNFFLEELVDLELEPNQVVLETDFKKEVAWVAEELVPACLKQDSESTNTEN